MRPESEMRALVSLLGDEQEKVVAVARAMLSRDRDVSIPFLEEGTRSPEPLVRGRARLLLEEFRRDDADVDWRRFVEQPDDALDLEEGCILLSQIWAPISGDSIRSFLDATAGMVRAHMSSVGGIHALGEVLFENLTFRGGDFENPRCHYLSTVLESRTGIPISLATIYVLVGKRAGLPVSGVAMPGHYLARFERPDGPLFVDCYNRGRIYHYSTLVDLLSNKGLSFNESYLAPATPRFTLHRMLNNLERLYFDAEDPVMTEKVRRLREYLGVQ